MNKTLIIVKNPKGPYGTHAKLAQEIDNGSNKPLKIYKVLGKQCSFKPLDGWKKTWIGEIATTEHKYFIGEKVVCEVDDNNNTCVILH